MVFQTLVRNR
ncbi:unnamed protein product [Acanthoscelides obtectus]|uniref:Uncharacterized protein n=1 Tax=Acanthoscelides obtectus TaxID=200917 RepID=A0A9P0QCE2_ACAOB|nr:unnamed protein product [Acanthoscelides obtectus]